MEYECDECPLPTHRLVLIFIVHVTEVDDTLVAAVQLLLRAQRDVVPEEVPELRDKQEKALHNMT